MIKLNPSYLDILYFVKVPTRFGINAVAKHFDFNPGQHWLELDS